MKLQLALIGTLLAVVVSTNGSSSGFSVNTWTPIVAPRGYQGRRPHAMFVTSPSAVPLGSRQHTKTSAVPLGSWKYPKTRASPYAASLHLRRSDVISGEPAASSPALPADQSSSSSVPALDVQTLTGESLVATQGNEIVPDAQILPPTTLDEVAEVVPTDVVADSLAVPQHLADYVIDAVPEVKPVEVTSEVEQTSATQSATLPDVPVLPQDVGVVDEVPLPPPPHNSDLIAMFPHFPHLPLPSFSGLDLRPRFSLLGVQTGGLPPTIIRITNNYTVKVPVLHPYPVDRPLPYPVKHVVPVKVDAPYPVPVPKPYPVVVDRPVHVPVDRPYPVPVHHAVPVPVEHPVPVPVPQPVPVEVSKPVAVPYPVPQPYKVIVDRPVQVPVDRPYPVAVPQAYPVPVEVPKPIGVPYPVDRPVLAPVYKPYPVPVAHPYPVQVEVPKHVGVPYPVDRPVLTPVYKPYPVPVPHAYPVPVEVPKPVAVTVPIEKKLSVSINTKPIVVNEYDDDLKNEDSQYDYKD